MKKYTQSEIDKISGFLKSEWDKEWMEEQNKPKEYLGKLAILICKKGKESYWITEGIDFVIS